MVFQPRPPAGPGRRLSRAGALATATIAAALLGCSSPGPDTEVPVEPATALTLEFHHLIDDQPIALGEPATTRYGQEVVFDHVRYWITNVAVGRGGETFAAAGSYHLIEQTGERERLSFTLDGLPEGTYDTLIFHIGVDPTHNAEGGPTAGELARGIGMDWGDERGYLFLRTEGQFEQEGLEGEFSFHVGTNVLYKRLTAALPTPLELSAGEEAKVAIEAEIDRIFAGVQLATGAQVDGGTVDSPAAQIAGNYSRMFRLPAEPKDVPFTPSSPNTEGPPDGGDIPKDSTPPTLTEPVVALAGALSCGEVPGRPDSEARACFTPFLLAADSASPADAGLFTFVTPNDEPVFAAAPGVVADVTYLDHSHLTHSDLFQISIRPNDDSAFWMEYRNVKNLQVAEGDTVAAGQKLGGAGDHFDPAFGAVSFGVRRTQELTQRLCPTRYTTPALEQVYSSALGVSDAAFPEMAHGALCTSASLVCAGDKCDAPQDFAEVPGDIDEGRRIYKADCASCHGDAGEGAVGPELCAGPGCTCKDCVDHATLAASIEKDMPPEGYCDERCSADVAAFIRYQFAKP